MKNRTSRSHISASGVIDAVDGKFFSAVILLLKRIRRTRFRIDERGQLLRLFVGQTAGVEVGQLIPNDARKRVHAPRPSAVVPRIRSPQRSRLLIANRDALSVLTMAVRAVLHEKRFSLSGVEVFNRNQVRRCDDVLAAPCRILPNLVSTCEPCE